MSIRFLLRVNPSCTLPSSCKQVESEKLAWLSSNASANHAALLTMRTFIPPDIWSTTQTALLEAGLSQPLAKRLWKTKVRLYNYKYNDIHVKAGW